MDGYQRHAKSVIPPGHAAELAVVDKLAQRLLAHIRDTSAEIAAIHVHGA